MTRRTVRLLLTALVAGATALPALPAAASTTPAASTASTAPAAAPAPNLASIPATSKQVVTVSAPTAGSTSGTLSAWQQQTDGSWRRVFGPMPAYVGTDGIGQASEGSGRTPAGTFPLNQAFGRNANPGTKMPYFRTDPLDWWDENPSSPTYNEHVRQQNSPGGASENLYYSGRAYDYAVNIGYNLARVPGAGSAFFLHVQLGEPTAGCVSIDEGSLGSILQWLDPAQNPQIDIRVGAAWTPPAAPRLSAAMATSAVKNLYAGLLGRSPNARETQAWATKLEQGLMTSGQVAGQIGGSTERRRLLVRTAYQQCLGRAPDSSGWSGYAAYLVHANWRELLVRLCTSPEALSRAHHDVGQWVTRLYRTMLQRSPSAAEVASWSHRVAAGGYPTTVRLVAASSEYTARMLNGQIYRPLLGRNADSGGRRVFAAAIPLRGLFDTPPAIADSGEFLHRG